MISIIGLYSITVGQNKIKWMSWDEMIEVRENDTIKKKFSLISSLVGVAGVRKWMHLHLPNKLSSIT